MCGIIFAFIVLAAIIASVLHVSAGWGLGIAAGVVVVGAIAYAKNPNTATRTGKVGLVYSNICPACRKHNKSGATKCRHCGTALVVPRVQAPAAESQATKTCPDCAEMVLAAARKCRYCGYQFAAT